MFSMINIVKRVKSAIARWWNKAPPESSRMRYVGESQFYKASEIADNYGLAEEVELEYAKCRSEGLEPDEALAEALFRWEL